MKLLTKRLFLNLKVVSFSIVTFIISMCYQLKYVNLGLSLILPSSVLALTSWSQEVYPLKRIDDCAADSSSDFKMRLKK